MRIANKPASEGAPGTHRIDLVTPFASPRMHDIVPTDPDHIEERFGTFINISLGEGFVGLVERIRGRGWHERIAQRSAPRAAADGARSAGSSAKRNSAHHRRHRERTTRPTAVLSTARRRARAVDPTTRALNRAREPQCKRTGALVVDNVNWTASSQVRGVHRAGPLIV
jgi:hypothetical protein